jgi:hypothetical protein
VSPAAASAPPAHEHAAGPEAALRRVVFADVFERLAAGFVDGRRKRGLPPETDESLREVFAGTLRLLHRVLFVAHAEARGFLPVGAAPAYQLYSLARLRRAAAARVDAGERLSDASTEAWDDLANLFDLVDHGDPALGVPGYGGGLFHPDENSRFLRENALSDAFLVRALDRLSRPAGEEADFASFGADEIASLCEGLLRMRLAPDERGRPRLVDARGERKDPGTHATPAWVVDYVLGETVGPALAAREAAFRDALQEAAARRERAAAGGPDAARLLREAGRLEERALTDLLSLRVCDPAMGGGHFLLHAADWIAARLLATAADLPGGPLAERLAALREEITEDLDAQGIGADPTRLTDEALLRRMVVRRCLFGVDPDPLAVDLAKATLWLHSFVPGAPPPFLDHHLRAGSPLAGARAAEVQRAVEESPQGQFLAFGGPFDGLAEAAAAVRELAARDDATFAEAADTAARFAEAERALAPYRRLLDLWVSRAFGNRRAEEVATLHAAEVLAGGARLGAAQREALERAAELARAHRFFHWDLELPEAFGDPARGGGGEAGFDAVVGRPPAARGEALAALRPHLAAAFAEVHEGSADAGAYFYRQALDLLRRRGRTAFVVPNRWVRSGAGEGLRRYLAEHARMETVVDFGHAPVLPDGEFSPCVVVVGRPEANGGAREGRDTRVAVVPPEAAGAGLGAWVAGHAHAVPQARFGAGPWSLEPQAVEALLRKLRDGGIALRDFAGSAPVAGVRTGLNEAYVVDGAARERLVREHPGAEPLLRPYLRAQEAGRWAPGWAGLWIVLLESGERRRWPWTGLSDPEAERAFRGAYPSLYAHLKPHEDRLRLRQDQGQHWWELRAGPPPGLLEAPRLVYPDVAWCAAFALDRHAHVAGGGLCFVPGDSPWLLAVLNSPVLWTYAWRSAGHGRDEAVRLTGPLVETLPVPEPTPAMEDEAAGAVERLVELTGERRTLAAELLQWVRAEYGVAQPGARLEAFADLSAGDFVDEVKRRRPRKADPLTPREVGMLRNAHAEYAPRLTAVHAKAAGLERRLGQLVERAWRLTPDEVELAGAAAPPRTPRGAER